MQILFYVVVSCHIHQSLEMEQQNCCLCMTDKLRNISEYDGLMEIYDTTHVAYDLQLRFYMDVQGFTVIFLGFF